MKTLKFFVGAAVAALVLASCGASKNTVTEKQAPKVDGTLLESNACMDLVDQNPAVRQWGNGKSFNQSTAVAMAEADARSKFASALEAKIKAATEQNTIDWTKYSGSDTEGASVTDNGTKLNNLIHSVANQTITNTKTIKTLRYMLPNRQYNVYVTLEYDGKVGDMAKKIAETVQQRVSDEDRMKMQFEFNKFKESIEKELEK
jgi:hypothetical protein